MQQELIKETIINFTGLTRDPGEPLFKHVIFFKIENTEFLYLNKELFLYSNRNSKKNHKSRIGI